MVSGKDVRPRKWSNVLDLYDDGEYSVIWGNYDGDYTHKSLGVRWNGAVGEYDEEEDEYVGSTRGYPTQGINPTFYVEPQFLARAIITELKIAVLTDATKGDINNIIAALKESES